MQLSAELRWFWKDLPQELETWFRDAAIHGSAPGGGETRIDQYLRDPNQQELGVKLRGGKRGVEIKGLVTQQATRSGITPFDAPIQIWCKWSTEAVTLGGSSLVDVAKRRYLRKFDTAEETPREIPLGPDERPLGGRLPDIGCNVEFTAVQVHQQPWWTLGFESFGTIDTVERSLVAVASILARRQPPSFEAGDLQSYPQWLSTTGKS